MNKLRVQGVTLDSRVCGCDPGRSQPGGGTASRIGCWETATTFTGLLQTCRDLRRPERITYYETFVEAVGSGRLTAQTGV